MNSDSRVVHVGSGSRWGGVLALLAVSACVLALCAVPAAALTGEGVSAAFTIDNRDATPPVTPVVTDDGGYTASANTLHASWTSSDPETGVAEFQYAIGTSPSDPGSGYVVGWTSNGTSAQVTSSGLSLQQGSVYYFYVKARNGVGMWSAAGASNGIKVDTTVPSRPVVMDSGAVQMDVAHLQASWTSSDPDSGIGEYQYAIGTSPADPGSGYVVGWTSTGTSSQVNRTGLSLESGRTYYFYVKAKNGCWQWSPVGTSDGILVDRTVAYYNDFEVGVGQEWSSQARDITPGTAQHPADRFLGQFGNDDVTLSLSDLPAHTTVSVTWDLYLIRSWDGNQAKLPCLDYVTGPDVWDLQADNARTLLHTTFSNVENWMGGYCPPETHPQAYPGTYPDASNAPHTGALEVNTLGYEFTAVKTESMDSVYRITRTFPHDSSQLSLDFRAQGLGDLNDVGAGSRDGPGLSGYNAAIYAVGDGRRCCRHTGFTSACGMDGVGPRVWDCGVHVRGWDRAQGPRRWLCGKLDDIRCCNVGHGIGSAYAAGRYLLLVCEGEECRWSMEQCRCKRWHHRDGPNTASDTGCDR